MDLKEFDNSKYIIIECTDINCLKYEYNNYHDAIERVFICYVKNNDIDDININNIINYVNLNIHFIRNNYNNCNEKNIISSDDIGNDVYKFYIKYINKQPKNDEDYVAYNDVNNECSIHYKDNINHDINIIKNDN